MLTREGQTIASTIDRTFENSITGRASAEPHGTCHSVRGFDPKKTWTERNRLPMKGDSGG
jgi:hypothetical protein